MGLRDELNRMCRRLRRKCHFKLCQRDFNRGTVRITKPGYYSLQENIVFSPNIENGGLPYARDKQYSGRPFVLGFFAAITIESPDVCLDLNGFELRQSEAHALLQSFYSHIELCNAPFVPKEGPADFVKTLRSANRVVVRNGCLGFSSHHAIHGNGAKKVLIEQLRIKLFTVAAISLNGGHDIMIRKVNAGPNRHDIPVLGTYSAAQFTVQLAEAFMNRYSDQMTQYEMSQLLRANGELHENIKAVFREVMTTGETKDPLYRNNEGVIDGNAYGMVIHPLGPAVNEFVRKVAKKQLVRGVCFEDVKIHGIKINVREIPAVSGKDGKDAQRGPAGAVFQFDQVSDGRPPHDRYYRGTKLSQLQIAMARPINRLGIKYGTFGVSQDLVDWASYGQRSGRYNINWKCDGDSMFHLNKGVIGLRLDAVKDGCFQNICIRDLENQGRLGNEAYCGAYKISHDAQKVPGYRGADAIGINISDSKALLFKDVDIRKVVAWNGIARGIRVMFDSCRITFKCVSIKGIKSGYVFRNGKWFGQSYYGQTVEYNSRLPNSIPASYGFEFYQTGYVQLREVKIDKLKGPITDNIYEN